MVKMERSPSCLFKSPRWLGYCHDGYEVVPLDRYLKIRPSRRDEDDEKIWRHVAAETQSMLTFGLLEAVVEKHIPERVLVRTDESGLAVLSRDNLKEVLEEWVHRIRQSFIPDLKPWVERIQKTLVHVRSLLTYFLKNNFWVFGPLEGDAPSMVCFVALIAEAVVSARRAFPLDLSGQGHFWSMIWSPPYRELAVDEMIKKGWCPSVAEYLMATNSVSALEYVSRCAPVEDGKHHDACSEGSCANYDVDPETYSPEHTAECQGLTSPGPRCGHLSPPFKDVEAMILGNEVPVLSLDHPPGAIPTLNVHRASDAHYVAISHVWADGLGSTAEKGLPLCQLRRIASLVAKIKPGAAFWADGLCIPGAENVRKKAIGMMSRTYSDAAAVLVLDGGLALCCSTDPLGVRLLRVLTSGWMRRLWTLQEAVLAKELHFNFADGQLNLQDLIPQTSRMLVDAYLGDLSSELFRMTKRSTHGSYSVGDVARSLRWRNTSRASDETLAIASLLGSKPSTLVKIGCPEARMARMLQDIGELPQNVLFLIGKKLQIPGFRWAPRSFMTAHGSGSGAMLATSGVNATVTPGGLESIYFAMIFPATAFAPGQQWVVKDAQGRAYQVTDVQPGVGAYTCDMLLAAERVPLGGISAGVCVLKTGERVGPDGAFTVHCQYVRRVLWRLLDLSDASPEITVACRLSGRLSTCIS